MMEQTAARCFEDRAQRSARDIISREFVFLRVALYMIPAGLQQIGVCFVAAELAADYGARDPTMASNVSWAFRAHVES